MHPLRDASLKLIPSTVTAWRTRRYTSTLYIRRTIRSVEYNPMDDGGQYSIQSPNDAPINVKERYRAFWRSAAEPRRPRERHSV